MPDVTRTHGAAQAQPNEEQMRQLVREVMAEPGLTEPRGDVASIKGQVQQLRDEFASIRTDFMQLLRATPRGAKGGEAQQAPGRDDRPVYDLAFSTPLEDQLVYGRAVAPFAVQLEDAKAASTLPATKLRAAMCQVDSDDEVAQLLLGETEVILRGGRAEFSGLTMGRLPTMKKGGTFRLTVLSEDSTCPYRVAQLFSEPLDVRAKPGKASGSGAQRPVLATPPAMFAAPSLAAQQLKRKPASNGELLSVAPAPSAAAPPPPAAAPAPAAPSWMEMLRPSAKKRPPAPEDAAVAHSAQVASLTTGLGAVSVGVAAAPPGGAAGGQQSGPPPVHAPLHRAQPSAGGPAAPPPPHAADGSDGAVPIGETKQPSSATLNALQLLGSSSLMELAMSVLGRGDSSENVRPRADQPSPAASRPPQGAVGRGRSEL